jgi:predicted nuclease of restriction endonuclease-like (RecB) superfamily
VPHGALERAGAPEADRRHALRANCALSRKPKAVVEAQLAEMREGDVLTPEMVLKDPYILDFLGITDRYLEKDLEDAILRELEAFILELGSGFTFVARQRSIRG